MLGLFWIPLLALALEAQPDSNSLVDIKKLDFSILVEMRFANKENVTRKQWYPNSRCYLRKRIAERLMRVQTALKLQNRGLKLLHCYLPSSLETTLQEALPAQASPHESSHAKGAAVDVVLVEKGIEYPWSTGHDSREAAPPGKKEESRAVLALEKALRKEGFERKGKGWSHFEHRDAALYLPEDIPFEALH